MYVGLVIAYNKPQNLISRHLCRPKRKNLRKYRQLYVDNI